MAGAGVTPQASPASLPVIRALLDETAGKGYRSGVLGIRAVPQWQGPDTFAHNDVTVRVEPCRSALAVREAILGRARGQWLVVLTDRPDDDLGAGLLSHLIGYRLRTPDPWEAVRLRFAASGIDSALTSLTDHRQVATGLLAATPAAGWPPAAAGVLTRGHAFAAVAHAHLGLSEPVIDLASVLRWMTAPGVTARIADMRELAGDPMTGAVLDWMAQRAGASARPLLHLLRSGDARDAVPLGLVAGLLAEPASTADAAAGGQDRIAREGLIRLEPMLGGQRPTPGALTTWAAESAAVITDLLGDPGGRAQGNRLLSRADELLRLAQAEGIADLSDLLPAGLTRRLALLAGTLRSAVRPIRPDTDLDQPQIRPADLAAVEAAWSQVATHRLAQPDPRTAPFQAAVRLSRWLAESGSASPAPPGTTPLAALIARHGDIDAWVDSAVNDAVQGVSDPDQGAALSAVIDAARRRRAAHDAAFAAALATNTSTERLTAGRGPRDADVWYLENLLPDVVIPLARSAPVLLLVLDGMSEGTGAEIVADILRAGTGWAESLLPGQNRRAAALAVLPTLTEVSRASLLSGELTHGGQDIELAGFHRLCRASGLPGAELFHKKPLDSARPGYAVAADVGGAIADVTGRPLVTCVLNTIDDALDRSDPGGTEWTAEAVRHLNPLLDRARNVGRVVILTADHGHVVERRQGVQRSYPEISSARSRPATTPPGPGEVLVEGQRVLLHDHRAVLAVDEQLRYGPLKAGYHGGASAAEAIVPVVALVPGAVPEHADLRLAPPQQPLWWADPASGELAGTTATLPQNGDADVGLSRQLRRRPSEKAPTLFDEPDGEHAPAGAPASTSPEETRSASAIATAAKVLASPAYAAQRRIAGRVVLTDEQVHRLLEALLAAPSHRLGPTQAAIALEASPLRLRGAILHAQQLLNVDGYAVLAHDADGVTVLLDEPLLREQFGISQ